MIVNALLWLHRVEPRLFRRADPRWVRTIGLAAMAIGLAFGAAALYCDRACIQAWVDSIALVGIGCQLVLEAR